MAKKKDEKVILENVELKPQILGYTFQKKNNIGRVIVIFIAFILVVYFIDDISVIFNNILGKDTASTIQNGTTNNKENNDNNDNSDNNNNQLYSFSEDVKIDLMNLLFDSFKLENKMLSFDINNLSSDTIDISDKKIFLETYDENKSLIDRFKLDINSIANNSNISLNLNVNQDFVYLNILEKNVEDYPSIVLDANELGESTITCNKNNETIIYTFKEASLMKISHKIVDNDVNNANYNSNLNVYQNKVNDFKQIEGVDASLTSDSSGYTVNIVVDLAKVDTSKIHEKYYYNYHDDAKIINFEMPAYGFNCE